ncbi:hypothetical protein Q8A67_005532 [Cirrhinus molitorella]|uniref:AIG1-type G domain-containing protein n=1 Tax=Cirrhinus molitorella TaxID=172907 RepID=A0AA88TRR9_9TELE|nr:hypothetical protein Q8A67_005532 [Cirrhinus molitorella]
MYEYRGDGSSVDGDQSRSGGPVRGDDKEKKDSDLKEGTKTASDGGETLLETKLQECEEMKRRIHSLETWFQSQAAAGRRSPDHDRPNMTTTGTTKLNIVLCGNDSTLKNLVSKHFRGVTNKPERSNVCVEREEKIDGQISVIELPALTQLSEEEVMRQTHRCLSLCHPGVHVFIIIIPDALLTDEDKAEIEEIQRIFSSRINKHIMILIKQNSEHQTAELNEETQSVIERFGGRHQFIDLNTQVSVLMEKLEQMVEENSGVCFSTETLMETQMEKLLKFEEMKRRIQSLKMWFQSQETGDRTQVTDLLQKIDNMVKANGDSYYSCKMFREMERGIQEQQMKILMEKVEQLNREKEELMNKHEEEKEKMKMKMEEEHDKERKRIEKYKQDIKEREEQERKLLEQMKRKQEEWEKQKEQERQRRDEEEEKWRKKEQTMWDEHNQKLQEERERSQKEKEDLQFKNEEERQHHEKERKKREEEFNKREEQYKRDIKAAEEQERKIREELKREREEWEKQKQQERKQRDEEEEKWRIRDKKTRDDSFQRLMQEREIKRREREDLQIKHEEERERMKMKMEDERQNHEKERKRREEEYKEREKRYKTDIEDIKEREGKIREEMKRDREKWEKQKQQERQRREEEDKQTHRHIDLYMETPAGLRTNSKSKQ